MAVDAFLAMLSERGLVESSNTLVRKLAVKLAQVNCARMPSHTCIVVLLSFVLLTAASRNDSYEAASCIMAVCLVIALWAVEE